MPSGIHAGGPPVLPKAEAPILPPCSKCLFHDGSVAAKRLLPTQFVTIIPSLRIAKTGPAANDPI